jgi:isopentenyldiphosphate isomerase
MALGGIDYLSIDRLRRGATSSGTAILLGYFLGRGADTLVIHALGPTDAAREIFSLSAHAWNAVSWASLAILAVAAARHITRSKPPVRAASILGFHGPQWGTAVTLQMCPIIREGWPMSAVQIHHTSKPYPMSEAHARAYRKYVEDNYMTKRFFDNQIKIMLTDNPVAFSDSPTLILRTQETRYSIVRYYNECVASVPAERTALLDALAQGDVRFPNSLCLQAVIITRDDQVLLTARSEKVAYHPGTWSCSIEEQLAPEDLQAGPQRAAEVWCRRLLHEELGLTDDTYRPDEARVLSVFLEGDILNISVCARLGLLLTARELDYVLQQSVRSDYEFADWMFLRPDDLPRELAHPTRSYHPTSSYRMQMELFHRHGTLTLVPAAGAR